MESTRRDFFKRFGSSFAAAFATSALITGDALTAKAFDRGDKLDFEDTTPLPICLPDEMELEVSENLIPFLLQNLDSIGRVRRLAFIKRGIIVPMIRCRDNVQLNPNVYIFKIRGLPVGVFTLYPDKCLVLGCQQVGSAPAGVAVKKTPFQCPGFWIEGTIKPDAEALGYTVLDPREMFETHLEKIIRQNAEILLTHSRTVEWIDCVKDKEPLVIAEAVMRFGVPHIQRILQALLRDGIPIRDMVTIMQAFVSDETRALDFTRQVEFIRNAINKRNMPFIDVAITNIGTLSAPGSTELVVGLTWDDRIHRPVVALQENGRHAREYLEQMRTAEIEIFEDAYLPRKLSRDHRMGDGLTPEFFAGEKKLWRRMWRKKSRFQHLYIPEAPTGPWT